MCADKCTDNKFAYNGECFDKCPEDTLIYENKCFDKPKCPHEAQAMNKEGTRCVSEC